MPKSDWVLGYVLPNVELPKDEAAPKELAMQFETEQLALVRPDDTRVEQIRSAYSNAGVLLDRFTDFRDNIIRPTVLICRRDARDTLSEDAVVAFRNAVAIPFILHDCATTSGPPRAWWSDHFDFSHATLDRHGNVAIFAPAHLTLFTRDAPFRAMAAPQVPQITLTPTADHYLNRALLRAWRREFARPGRGDRFGRVLFRSLETAYQALGTPLKNQGSLHEHGTAIGIWVSALEILAHPGKGQVQQTDVLDLIEHYRWNQPSLRAKRYVAHIGKLRRRVNVIQRAYKYLYDARNDFLHGNRVSERKLFPFGLEPERSLIVLASAVYRAALAAYLERRYALGRSPKKRSRVQALEIAEVAFYERRLVRLFGLR